MGSPTREYIYSGSALLATIEGATTTYHHQDHLSVRVNTDTNGNVVGQQGSFPFGEAWYTTSTTTKWRFTSYERDAESGNDYAIFRYHSNRLGRFTSPDPIAGGITNPQSLNRYTYVLNNPVDFVDPLGLECHPVPGGIHCDVGAPSPPPVDPFPNSGNPYGGGSSGEANFPELILFPGLPGGGTPDRPDVENAKKLIDKEDCEQFLAQVSQQAAQLGYSSQRPLNEATRGWVSQETSPTALKNKLGGASYKESRHETPRTGPYSTAARADFDQQSVTLYAPYFSMSPLAQAQTLVHESLHLALNFTDPQLAQAATGKTYPDTKEGRSQASADFQQKLAEKCR